MYSCASFEIDIGWRDVVLVVLLYFFGRYLFPFFSTSTAPVLLKWDDDEGAARNMLMVLYEVASNGLVVRSVGEIVSIHRSTSIAFNEMHVNRWCPYF